MSITYSPCLKCLAINRVDSAKAEGSAAKCSKCRTPLPIHDSYSNVSSEALEAMITHSPIPVVVDFWAEWCGPCRSFAPTFAQAAQQAGSDYAFVKLDTEKWQEPSQRYQVRGIPTLILFHRGAELNRISGAMPLPQFLSWLRSHKS